MKLVTLKRSSIVLILAIGGAMIGSTASSAAPKTNSQSSMEQPVLAYSMLADGGGSTSDSPQLTPAEIASDLGAIVRPAGGAGFLASLVRTIYQTARICPECFAW